MESMSLVRLLGLSLISLGLPSLSSAGFDSYECEAHQFLSWSAEVELNPWPPKFEEGMEIGEHPQHILDPIKRFTVSRQSGQVIGGPLDTQGSRTVSVKKFDRGSEDGSFKVLIQDGWGAAWLVIHKWWAGTDKPFVAMDVGGNVYTGVCR